MRIGTRPRKLVAALAAAGLAAVVSGCGSDSVSASGTTINWWTWDDKQAAAYQQCADVFEKDNPGVTVKISQYDVNDYFTKLLSGFVADTAPDAFMNSGQYLQQYAALNQLEPLDGYVKKSDFDLKKYATGSGFYRYTDGKLYALPMDWSTAGLYYNQDMLKKAGYTAADMNNLTWNPDDGGTFGKMIAHLTVDSKGRRGDQPGFDKKHIKVYGIGALGVQDFTGQTSWNPLVSTLGWRMGDKATWPTTFTYDDPRFVKTMNWVRGITDKGYAPTEGEFTSAGNAPSSSQLLGSGKVAIANDGSWSATQYPDIPKLHYGVAPEPKGPDGKRSAEANSNGNMIWSGSRHKDLTWKWVSYQESEQCQTMAGKSGTFFPSIAASMDASAATLKKKGVDLSPFIDAQKSGALYPVPAYGNGTAIQKTAQPLLQSFFSHDRNDDVFRQITEETRKILAQKEE
ncbi:ABC transporter substrate-binding protein [Streptomyces sp. NBC_01497]|uniref:ABC transporter substrate-binding protein n=1 Tax=Streptomyces sp. NBC_01497 TaxID=2903885 RepID=UPI002E35F089|nr:sugar ABC transporter substrate-binding protein [Streptomyces sp. NBC_01497]